MLSASLHVYFALCVGGLKLPLLILIPPERNYSHTRESRPTNFAIELIACFYFYTKKTSLQSFVTHVLKWSTRYNMIFSNSYKLDGDLYVDFP